MANVGNDQSFGETDSQGSARLDSDEAVWESSSDSGPGRGRRTALGSRHIPQRAGTLVALAIAVAGIAVIALAVLARDGDGPSLDPAVEELVPAKDAESVPVQSSVTIDLVDRPQYSISLRINGVAIPASEVLGGDRPNRLNRLTYLVGRGQTVEELRPGRNCVQAEFYSITEGPEAARSVNWCFEAL